jgi:hypothetical protein
MFYVQNIIKESFIIIIEHSILKKKAKINQEEDMLQRRPFLLVHAIIDDEDISYISTSKTRTIEKNNGRCFLFTNFR